MRWYHNDKKFSDRLRPPLHYWYVYVARQWRRNKKASRTDVSSFLSPSAQQWDIILLVICVYNTYYIVHNSSYAYYILCARAHTQARAHGVSLLRSQNQYNVSLWFIRRGGRFEMSGSRLIFSAMEWERVREWDRVGEREREKYHRRTQKPLGMPCTPPIVQSRRGRVTRRGRGDEKARCLSPVLIMSRRVNHEPPPPPDSRCFVASSRVTLRSTFWLAYYIYILHYILYIRLP